MIKNKLLNEEWYLNKISMFLKESFGIKDQHNYFFNQLLSLNLTCDDIIKSLDIYNKFFWGSNIRINWDWEINGEIKSFTSYEELVDYFDKEEINLKFLDIIASMLGIQREFGIIYISSEGTKNKEYIKLNNKELLVYIKITIAKNNFDGTYEMIKNAYNNCGIGENSILYYTISANDMENNTYFPLTCKIIIRIDYLTENLIKLFRSKLILITSLGIQYEYTEISDGQVVFTLDMNNNLDNYKFIL